MVSDWQKFKRICLEQEEKETSGLAQVLVPISMLKQIFRYLSDSVVLSLQL